MTDMITASCRCGKLKFSSHEQPVIHLSCHCADCRAATSDDYSNIAFFKQGESIVSGAVRTMSFTAGSGNLTSREACPNCGTIMFDKSEGFPGLIGVFSNNIKQIDLDEPSCHVWLESKLPHVKLAAGSKTYNNGIR